MESPISISSPNFRNGDSFVYEADESEPESPSDFQSSVSSLKDKFYLNSYVLIGSQGKILNGTKKNQRTSPVRNSDSSRSGSQSPLDSASSSLESSIHCPQLRLTAHYDLDHSTGVRRGLEGHKDDHLSFLHVSLFSLFYFSDSSDRWILHESESKSAVISKKSNAIRRILTNEIIFSLRNSYFCPQEKVLKLYKTIFPQMSSPQDLEIGKFLNLFLGTILNLNETIHYTSTTSEIILTLKTLNLLDSASLPSTLQRLTEFTMSQNDRKLLSIPRPVLFLSLPSTLTSLPHEPLVPNLQLDLSPFLIRLRHDEDFSSSSSDDNSAFEIIRSYRSKQSTRKQSFVGYIKESFSSAFSHLQVMVETLPQIFSPSEAIFSVTEINVDDRSASPLRLQVSPSPIPSHLPPLVHPSRRKRPEVFMDLMAVICLDRSGNYSAFVRCGHNPRRGFSCWALYNPSGDKNVPEVRLLDKNFTKSLRKLERLQHKKLILEEWKRFPKHVHEMLTFSTFFIYDTKPQPL